MVDHDGFITEHFVCECHSDEHTTRWDYVENPDFGSELSTSVFLNNDFIRLDLNIPIWVPDFVYHSIYWIAARIRRTWIGIKYIFGYKCKYGHWDCFNLHPEDCDRLIEFIQKYKKARKGNNNGQKKISSNRVKFAIRRRNYKLRNDF
jgi:hypothetical protein